MEVTADSGRGAGALKDKARSVRVINTMTAKEARFSFDPDVLAEIMWGLAHEAGRLGLSDTIPKECKRHFAAAAEAA
jgi:hypothetical protein